MREGHRDPDPARRDMTPRLRQQPQDREHSLLDARKLADDELAAQPLHLVADAVVQRWNQTGRTPCHREEVLAENGHGHRSGRAKDDLFEPGGRLGFGLDQEVAGPEQLNSGLLADLDGVHGHAIEHAGGKRLMCSKDRFELKRSLRHLDDRQRHCRKLRTFVRRQPARELEFGIE